MKLEIKLNRLPEVNNVVFFVLKVLLRPYLVLC